ncbi:unnamed protein product [Peniophora sp. CBMAI 1063]|nr:unnamed protein product [Peniophora sp. CBMAI 1063]
MDSSSKIVPARRAWRDVWKEVADIIRRAQARRLRHPMPLLLSLASANITGRTNRGYAHYVDSTGDLLVGPAGLHHRTTSDDEDRHLDHASEVRSPDSIIVLVWLSGVGSQFGCALRELCRSQKVFGDGLHEPLRGLQWKLHQHTQETDRDQSMLRPLESLNGGAISVVRVPAHRIDENKTRKGRRFTSLAAYLRLQAAVYLPRLGKIQPKTGHKRPKPAKPSTGAGQLSCAMTVRYVVAPTVHAAKALQAVDV